MTRSGRMRSVPDSAAPTLRRLIASLSAASMILAGCTLVRSDPAKATRPYPFWLKQGETLPIQVLTEGDSMVVVNATTRDFSAIDLWMNQRYLYHLAELPAGANARIYLGDFWDVRGEGPNPGGALRYFEPTPIRLVQIQVDDTTPLIGLEAVLTEAETR